MCSMLNARWRSYLFQHPCCHSVLEHAEDSYHWTGISRVGLSWFPQLASDDLYQ